MKPNLTRILVAQLAAKLICEHGIREYSLAKRKAARQLGIIDAHHLPDNAEIEAAIRDHQSLYYADSHPESLRQLRQAALGVMQQLADFDPHLTGAVLNGTASPYSDIHIELFGDSEKDVEMYLLNHNIPFRQAQAQTVSPHGGRTIPCFILQNETHDIRITLQPRTANRHSSRAHGAESPKRASLSQLAALLAQDTPPPPAS